MSNIAIRVENLGKEYRIGATQARYRTIRETVMDAARAPFARAGKLLRGEATGAANLDETIWALKDVSFEVKHGEVVGIIGRNGAGKSTLLKILSRITEPTTGYVDLYGRVGSLLEVGTGFHPELTGRENIFLNGAILGMSRNDINRKFDEIVDFAEVERFIDTPVKHYSSGMYLRLAFAVAAHLEPEILLVDEVLAVGDAAFQKKCLGKMGDVAQEGRTVLFVSHNMGAVENLCARSVMIDAGKIALIGNTNEVVGRYMQHTYAESEATSGLANVANRRGNGRIRLTNFAVEDMNGNRLNAVATGSDIALTFGYEVLDSEPLRNVDIGFSIHSTRTNEALVVLYSSYTGTSFSGIPKRGTFRCELGGFPLNSGRYRIGARIVVGGIESDWPVDGVGFINVESGDFFGSGQPGFNNRVPFLMNGKWAVNASSSSSRV